MTDITSLSGLLRLARDTISNPREGAETVLSLAPPREALIYMFALVVVVSIFLGEVGALFTGPTPEGLLTGRSPIWLGLVQAAFLFAMMHAVHRIGQWFGGNGAFEEAALLVIWLQFILILLQVLQVIVIVAMPAFIGLIAVISIGVFFWLLVNFIAVLHGFTSLGMVFLMTLGSGFSIIFLLSLVLTLLGLVPDPGAPS